METSRYEQLPRQADADSSQGGKAVLIQGELILLAVETGAPPGDFARRTQIGRRAGAGRTVLEKSDMTLHVIISLGLALILFVIAGVLAVRKHRPT